VKLSDEKVSKLSLHIEETLRAGKQKPLTYIDTHNNLQKALLGQHHVVFGRRGSGKTSLLKQIFDERGNRAKYSVWIDIEPLKKLSYPDVLIQIIRTIFKDLKEFLEGKKSGISMFDRILKKKKAHAQLESTLESLEVSHKEWEDLLNEFEESETEHQSRKKIVDSTNQATKIEAKGDLKVVSVGTRVGNGKAEIKETEFSVTKTARELKIEKVERGLLDIKNLLEKATELIGNNLFIIVDDFYFLHLDDQTPVADYLHRLCKNSNLFLKFGTIRYRTILYQRNSMIQGLQLHHDVVPIDLDHTLQNYQDVSIFLMSIRDTVCRQVKIDAPEELFAGDSWDQVVLASGGVPRDFLNIFKRSLELGRNKQEDKVNKNIINEATRLYYEDTKKQDLSQDAGSGKQDIEILLEDIVQFCVEEKHRNCFLLDKSELDSHPDQYELVKQLVDFRLIHQVHENTSCAKRPGRFEAYVLDLGTFAHPDRRRDKRVQIVKFWQSDESGRLQELVHSPMYPLRSRDDLYKIHEERAKTSSSDSKRPQHAKKPERIKMDSQTSFLSGLDQSPRTKPS
jgi:hypothetical protein